MNRIWSWFAPLSLILLTVFVFTRSLTAEFVEWDDPTTIAANPAFNPPTWPAILRYWNPRHAEMSLYMPLTQTVWGSLASVGRIEESDGAAPTLNPWIFHGANVLIHVASSLLILHILQSLTRNRPAAWFGAALFAVHPVQVESVAWASGTKDLLCVFFILVSIALLIAHRAKPHPARMSLMTVAIAATCLSKPTGIVGPVMLLIIDVMLLGTSPRRSLQALAPALVIACVFAVIAQRVQPPVIAQLPPLWSRPLIAGDALAFYLVKLVWPTRLAIDYGRSPAKVMAQGWLYYTWLLPAVVTILLIWIRRHNPAMIRTVIAAAILALAGVAPVLGLVPFTFQAFSTVADHYLYPSMIGVALLAAAALLRARYAAWFAIAELVIAVLSIRSFDATRHWRDSNALFAHTLDVNPRSAMAHTNWAVALTHQHEDAAAIDHLQQAVLIDSDYAFAHLNLAGLLLKQNDRTAAAREYREVLRIYQTQRNYDPSLADSVRKMVARLDANKPPEQP